MKTRNWHITQLAPDHYLCSYERGKDEHGPSNRVKSIQIITKPDSDGCIFVKTDDLPVTYSTYLNSWNYSDSRTFVIDSLESLASCADENICELKDYFDDKFRKSYIGLLLNTMNHDIVNVEKSLDKLSANGAAYIEHAIFDESSWTDSNGQEIWKESLSPFLYAAWSGDINIVKLMISYLPDYYQHKAATVLARLLEVGTDQGPLMQPYLDLANKSKQLAAQFKWNSGLTMEQRLSALKELGESQKKLPLFGIFLLCDPAFYKPGYTYLEDNKRNKLIDDIPIRTDDLGNNSIIYKRRYHDPRPTLGSLGSVDRLPTFDGQPALFTAEALMKYYKKVKLELSHLILSCQKKYDPDVVHPIDGLVGFSDIQGRGISLFYPKHAFEEDQIASANNKLRSHNFTTMNIK